MRLPDGAWDCHAHVFEAPSRFPPAPGRDYDPPAAPLEKYLEMLDTHGLARGVLVQPSVYGFDNRCMLEALGRASGRLVGVAVPAPDTTPAELEALHRRGIRGVRCNLLNSGGLPVEAVVRWQPVLADLGWHVALHVDVAGIADLRGYLSQFALPVVIDHMGRPAVGEATLPAVGEATLPAVGGATLPAVGGATLPAVGGATLPAGEAAPPAPAFGELVDLVREGACFVKLSAPYRLSSASPPWPDVAPIARALLWANPSRCLWATDWPHSDTATAVRIGDLLNALEAWCPRAETREFVLTRAPAELFGAGAA